MPQSRADARKGRNGEGAGRHRSAEAPPSAGDRPLTTDAGQVITDNHNSLRAGERGPALLEDFLLREKLTHFDRERIPERVVHARGAGAHGYFEATKPLGPFTRAAFLQESGTRTPVFVRFSNLAGERGSADTVRDARGFAIKFYTAEGNFDLVGASFPVAFVQDAIKYPDYVHALKPQPQHGMPQASSGHDSFWDFVSLVPESTHAVLWLMSDRALPRSWRMMDGFGVHSFRLVNAHGTAHWAKFHLRPKLGRHALAWDEARKIAGRDPDFHRRDLWEAIEQGAYPEWEVGVQLLTDEKAQALGIELLDPTKLVPEELVPVQAIGRLVLDRNPGNFFAETEQVAFNPGHVVPGIALSDDPLLQGRLFAYLDAQVARLGGPNFNALPVNRPQCPFHNHYRDGAHRTDSPGPAASYEPHALTGGAEFRVDGGQRGDSLDARPVEAERVRRRGASFDDHFSQATLFWNSQGIAEKEHLVCALQEELSRVKSAVIRQRVVDNLAHVDAKLARKVAEPLGLLADARAAAGRAGFRERKGARAGTETSAALSMESASCPVATRRVAVLAAPGVEIGALKVVQQSLADQQVGFSVVGLHLGSVATSSGQQLPVDHGVQAVSSVQFDAVFVPGGASHVQALAACGAAVHFVLEAYRHGKPICVVGDALQLLQLAGFESGAASAEGVVVGSGDPASRLPMAQEFLAALARHRHWHRSRADGVPA